MDRDRLRGELVTDEGMKLKPYVDTTGNWTIGVGRNLLDTGITKSEAYFLLNNDMATAEIDLDRELPWWRSLSDDRQRVLANMCFNLGITRLLGFRRMLAAVQAGAYNTAADEMLNSKWAAQVKDRAVRLAERMRGKKEEQPIS